MDPASFEVLLEIPIKVSTLYLKATGYFPIVKLCRVSYQLPFQVGSRFTFFDVFGGSYIFVVSPFCSVVVAHASACIGGGGYGRMWGGRECFSGFFVSFR